MAKSLVNVVPSDPIVIRNSSAHGSLPCGGNPTSTTSLTTGEPAEKSYIEWFLEAKSRSLGPTL